MTLSSHRMLKIYRRFKMAARTGEFFALHQWDFISKNIQELNKDITVSERNLFPVDITKVVWDTYVRDYVFGIRKYVIKDPPSTIPQALSKLQKWVLDNSMVVLICQSITKGCGPGVQMSKLKFFPKKLKVVIYCL